MTTTTVEPEAFDLVGSIIDYESGEMDEATAIVFFQHLVDTGLVWRLQGSYGRAATALIEQGLVAPPQED